MAGLRERKKENRKLRILDSAFRLFSEQGFEKTTMERIAAEAELGVGTLYNYYPSKTILLFSIIEAGVGKYVAELEEVIEKGLSLKESVFAFYEIYLKSFATYGKKIWGELFGIALFKQPSVEKMIDVIDSRFIDKLKVLLSSCKTRGILKDRTDIETAVSVLYALLGYNIIRYVSETEMAEVELVSALRSQAELLLNALTE